MRYLTIMKTGERLSFECSKMIEHWENMSPSAKQVAAQKHVEYLNKVDVGYATHHLDVYGCFSRPPLQGVFSSDECNYTKTELGRKDSRCEGCIWKGNL